MNQKIVHFKSKMKQEHVDTLKEEHVLKAHNVDSLIQSNTVNTFQSVSKVQAVFILNKICVVSFILAMVCKTLATKAALNKHIGTKHVGTEPNAGISILLVNLHIQERVFSLLRKPTGLP